MRNPVKLVRYNKEHYDLLWNMYNDDRYSEFFRRCPPAWKKEDIDNFEANTDSQIFACKLEGLEPIGFCVVKKVDWFELGAQVGLVLFEEYQDEVRNQHKFAFWCMLALARMLFDKMPLRRLSFRFLSKRIDIERSLAKAGMRKEGEYRQSCIHDGVMEDELEYCLDKEHYDMMYK